MDDYIFFSTSLRRSHFDSARTGPVSMQQPFRELAARKPSRVAAYTLGQTPLAADLVEAARVSGIEIVALPTDQALQRYLREMAPAKVYSALPYALGEMDFGQAQFIGTIHGLRPMEMPADATAWRYSRGVSDCLKAQVRLLASRWYVKHMERQFRAMLTLRAASRIYVVPSEYTKTSLLNRFPFLERSRLHALYSPSTILAELPEREHRVPDVVAGNPRAFILLVSGDRWVKNSYRALQALERVYAACELDRRWPVVITGNCPRWFPRRWKELFHFVGRCSAAELAGMYATAGLFIYPSLNEGFGYPPIEAMAYGTPVLASGIGATTEIAAEGAAYFCPVDVSDIETRIATLLFSATMRERLSRMARERHRIVRERQARDLGELCNLLLS